MIKRKCIVCKKVFYTYPCRLNGDYGHLAKYCSKVCANKVSLKKLIEVGKIHRFEKGHVSFSKLYPEKLPSGISHWEWKGENVGYRGLHYWIRRQKGIPKICETCGEEANDWANIDHKYKRNINDYIALCKSCHKLYDLSYNPTHLRF